MAVIDLLQALRNAIRDALPGVAVVEAHTQDLSDAQTGRWLVRLPGVYLVGESVDVARGEATLRLRAYIIARLADLRSAASVAGWEIAEGVLAVISAQPHVRRAQLIYRDEAGLDQPGIGLWEIIADRAYELQIPTPSCLVHLRAEEFYSSWAPWIGAEHEQYYQPVTGDEPDPGITIDKLIP